MRVNGSGCELFYSNGTDAVDLRRSTSPQCQRMLSTEESDVLLEAVLTQRTNLLSDPDLQMVLRKSYSLDDLQDPNVPVLYCSVLLAYLLVYFMQQASRVGIFSSTQIEINRCTQGQYLNKCV